MFSVYKLWVSIMSCCPGLYVLKFFLALLEGSQIIEMYDFFFTASGFLVLFLVVGLTIWYGPNQRGANVLAFGSASIPAVPDKKG